MDEIMKEYPFRTVLSLKPLIDRVKQAASDSASAGGLQTDGLQELLDSAPELQGPIQDLSVLKRHGELLQKLMSLVFPPLFLDAEAVAAVIPFSMKPIFVSPSFKRIFLNKDGSLAGRLNLDEATFYRGRSIRAYLFILEKYYDIHENFDYPLIRTVPDSETGLDRYYRILADFRFVEPHALKEPKPLTKEERATVLEHLTEPEVLEKILPPRDFELRGFTILHGVDVTESEVLAALGRDLVDQESIISEKGFLRLQNRLRTLFHRPSLVAGLTAIQQDQVLLLNPGCRLTESCIFASSHHVPVSEFTGTVFERAVSGGSVLRVPDTLEDPSLMQCKGDFLEMGARSLLIAPLHFKGQCIGTLHLGSPEPGDLGPMDGLLMEQVRPLFAMAINRSLNDFEHKVQGIIKQECTAIHPTVEWRFREAALKYLVNIRMGQTSKMETIVFRDVYPLYSTSDIRGSTDERNKAIQQDLADHLDLGLKVVLSASEAKPLLILQELARRINTQLDSVQGLLHTGDELSVVKFLRDEVETIFPHLRGFGAKVLDAINAYESAIDGNVGTVYRMRREFEESVHILNNRLITYLDQEEVEAQRIFPHYFERHRTDGVDYLIYLGASLTEGGEFNELYLRNLRLWQLKVACGMAWHTAELQSSLKVPLDTAHMILAQETPLSIRFRFDEKRFDADGAYDIRHEIMKSRIDKAVVKGSTERLTQPGKIAIVYAHPEERKEMLRHVDFLQSEGYLSGNPETMELDDMPGVQGLKALRVSVNIESEALAERARLMLGQGNGRKV